MRIYLGLCFACMSALNVSSAVGQPSAKEVILVGPWSITTTYKANRFDNCVMSRTGDEINAGFVLAKDSFLIELDSAKWHLERGKTYPVKLVIGSRVYDAKALAETKTVTIDIGDRSLSDALKVGTSLEVQGEGATIRVPLDGSAAAFDRLTMCFNKNSHTGTETNPFVAPSQKP
jgi:hypothetical protein